MILEVLTKFLRWESLVAVIAVWLVFKIISWMQSPLRKIPGPTGSLIFGTTFEMGSPNDEQQLTAKWREEYGDIYKTWHIVGGYRVFISNPDYIKKVLVQNPTSYARPDFLQKLFKSIFSGRSLFNSNGKDHAMQRKMLNPAFSYASVQKFVPIFNEKSEQLIKYWEDKIDELRGSSFEEKIQRKFTNLTLDVIGESAFGYEFNSISGNHSEESQATDKILRGEFGSRRRVMELLFPFLRFFPSKSREEIFKAAKVFNELIRKVVEQRRKESTNPDAPKRNDLLTLMLEMADDEGNKFSDDDLHGQVRTFMIAGHETTSMAMTWTTLLLSKYPRIQAKVRDEIRGIMDKGEELTYEKLSKMKYLDNCIKEAMRLYPPAVAFGRTVLKDVKIGPYVIPKGVTLMVDVGVSHRDAKFWNDPEVFNPDRFDKPASGEEQQPMFPYRFLPFSRGPRMCIGYRFAELELKVVMAKLLRSFHFELGKNQASDFKAEVVLTLRPNPAPVIAISKID